MPALNLTDLQALLGVIGAVGGFIVTCAVFLWRVSAKVHEITLTQAALTKSSETARLQFAHTGKLIRQSLDSAGARIGDLERGLAVLAASLGEREKDTTKLEAKMEQAHDDTLKVVASLAQVMGSLDSVWRTLARIHPEHVPRRASDRNGG